MMNSGLSASDVAVLTGNAGNSRGCNDAAYGGWGAEWFLWIIVIFALFGGWGNGFGGWGGNGGGTNTPGFQGFATRSDIDAALSTRGIENGITGIGTQLCNGFAGVNSAIANLGYQTQQCLNRFAKAIANLFTKNVNTVGTYA